MQNPRGKTVLEARALIAGLAILGFGAVATANGPEDGTGRTSITVVPSDDLPAIAAVEVSGTGFEPLNGVELLECARLPGTDEWRASGPQRPTVCSLATTTTLTDADGNFGPVTFQVSRTFDGFTRARGQQVSFTYTCLAADDCIVVANQFFGGPNTIAWHHLSFAP